MLNKSNNYNLPNLILLLRFIVALIIIGLLITFNQLGYNDSSQGVVIISVVLALFITAALSDWADGFLARHYNQVTSFGKFFDPIVDKILINSLLIFFAYFGWIPVWITLVLIIRDLLVDGLRMNLSINQQVLSASRMGKWKTFFEMIGIVIIFIGVITDINLGSGQLTTPLFFNPTYQTFYLLPLLLAVIFSLASLVQYLKSNLHQIL